MQFTKMQGIGNDFVVVDELTLPIDSDFSKLALRLCNRHFGIGADGLLVVGHSDGCVTMRMFNPDGSEDMCGNGLRCAALWAYTNKWTNGLRNFNILTRDGLKACRIISDKTGNSEAQIEVEMSKPVFDPLLIPVSLPDGMDPQNFSLEVEDKTFQICALNTGSTHSVIYGPQPSEAVFQQYSPAIEVDPAFPERTSIMWTSRIDDHALDLRIWERGAGETLGCGTGACAAVVALVKTGVIQAGSPVKVRSKGGILSINWDGESAVLMTGPAAIVYSGHWTMDVEA